MYKPVFADAAAICGNIAELARPPRRIRVSEATAETVRVASPSGSSEWDAALTPYMIAPMDDLASRRYEAVVFVGPARSGKTQALVDGWISYAVTCDPGDMLLYFPTELNAYDFAKRRLRRLIDNSPKLAAMRSPVGHDNNLGMTIFRHGMILSLEWPTSSHLAQKDARYIGLSDYDSMPDDVSGEGSPFDLGKKRVQAMMSAGMAMVESSPKRPLVESDWRPNRTHEAPPVDGGILPLYNRGNRHRWHWDCLHCGASFEAPGLPDYDESDDVEKAAASARVVCRHCGGIHWPKDKRALQQTGHWVADPAVDSTTIASYWVKGCAAAFQSWPSLVRNYAAALKAYQQTGLEEALKTTVNVDQGEPYTPQYMLHDDDYSPEKRKEEIDRFYVPDWTRFLLCAVDVQGGTKARFVVQVHAIGVDMESTIVDRYDITESPRGDNIRIDPASYPEDWDALTDRVINATYRIDDEQELQVYHTVVDYGGEDGVSVNAAAWRQRLRRQRLADRVTLSKGDGKMQAMVQKTNARDRNGKKMRDVPLMLFSADQFKDLVSASMRRTEPGPTYMHFPKWLKQWFFDELRAEVRQKNGKWKKIRARNEALDCWCMIWALAYLLGPADTRRPFNWASPPTWAAPLDSNSHVVSKERRREMQSPQKIKPKPSSYLI